MPFVKGEDELMHFVPEVAKKKRGRKRHTRAQEKALGAPKSEVIPQPPSTFGTLEELIWSGEGVPHTFGDFISQCTFVRLNADHFRDIAEQLGDHIRSARQSNLGKSIKVKNLPWGLRAQLALIANNFGLDANIFHAESEVIEEKDLHKLSNIKSHLLSVAESKLPNPRPFSRMAQPGVSDYTWNAHVGHDPRASKPKRNP